MTLEEISDISPASRWRNKGLERLDGLLDPYPRSGGICETQPQVNALAITAPLPCVPCVLCSFFPPLKSAFFKNFPPLLKRCDNVAQFPFSCILAREKCPLKLKSRSLNGGILGISERRTEGLLDQSSAPDIIPRRSHASSTSQFDFLNEEVQIQGRERNKRTYRQSSRRKKKKSNWSNPSSCNKEPLQRNVSFWIWYQL